MPCGWWRSPMSPGNNWQLPWRMPGWRWSGWNARHQPWRMYFWLLHKACSWIGEISDGEKSDCALFRPGSDGAGGDGCGIVLGCRADGLVASLGAACRHGSLDHCHGCRHSPHQPRAAGGTIGTAPGRQALGHGDHESARSVPAGAVHHCRAGSPPWLDRGFFPPVAVPCAGDCCPGICTGGVGNC